MHPSEYGEPETPAHGEFDRNRDAITLPLIRQPLLVAIVFRLLDSLRVFDLIYVLTANGSTTISMSGFVRREMVEYGNMGFGSAASTSLFLIIMLTAILFLRLARVKLAEDAR